LLESFKCFSDSFLLLSRNLYGSSSSRIIHHLSRAFIFLARLLLLQYLQRTLFPSLSFYPLSILRLVRRSQDKFWYSYFSALVSR